LYDDEYVRIKEKEIMMMREKGRYRGKMARSC
jgi:hypothetical protein